MKPLQLWRGGGKCLYNRQVGTMALGSGFVLSLLLIGLSLGPMVPRVGAVQASGSIDILSVEAGEKYTLVEHPPTDPNGSWGPTVKQYFPDTYIFNPNGITLGLHGFLAQGIRAIRLNITNDDPRQLDHTFTLAKPDGSPLYTLWLNRTGSANTTAMVSLTFFVNGTLQVNGGPLIQALVGSLAGSNPELSIGFYCLHHRSLGMAGQISLAPLPEGNQPTPPPAAQGTETPWVVVATMAGVGTTVAVLKLRHRSKLGK